VLFFFVSAGRPRALWAVGMRAPSFALASPLAVCISICLPLGCQRTAQEDFVRSGVAAGFPVVVVDASPVQAPSSEDPTRNVAALPSGRCLKLTPSDAPAPPVASGPAPGCPPDPEPQQPRLPQAHLSFPDVASVVVDADLVRSEHDTARGLMFRRSMPEDRGMLFDLRFRDDHKFWMHNTCIPLDLLFVDEDGLIVGIVESAPTLDDTSRGVGCPSRWVLEVNAGWSRRHGVKAGQHVRLP
jgi:uncharacterized membrane protein (UPF0127 family)